VKHRNILRSPPNCRLVQTNSSQNIMDVQRLAELASLNLTPEEVDQFEMQLRQVVDYMKQIDLVDVSGTAMMDTCMQEGVRLRDDEPGQRLDRDAVLSNAKESHRGYFVVPRIL